MKMHVLSGGCLRMRRSIFVPEAERGETIDLPVSCYLLRHAQGNVLFDTGCHPDVATSAAGRWGAAVKSMQPVMAPDDNVIASLAAVGLRPDDIDVVVNSHLHTDHCGCNGFFGRASFVAHADEVATAADPAQEGKGYYRADWGVPGGYDTMTRERDLFGDGRIVLVPLPGHSHGTIAGLVTLDRAGRFLLAADVVSLRENLDRETVPRNTWDAAAFVRSLAEVRRIEASGATVVCGHDAAQLRTLRQGIQAYD
jgi:N-acyl homoserine lactone hydrolase